MVELVCVIEVPYGPHFGMERAVGTGWFYLMNAVFDKGQHSTVRPGYMDATGLDKNSGAINVTLHSIQQLN